MYKYYKHAIRGQIDRARKELSELGQSLKDAMGEIRRKCHALATKVYQSDAVLFFGRNELYPAALEAAGRISEVSGLKAVGLEKPSTGTQGLFKPASSDTCVFFIPRKDEAALRSLTEAQQAGARTLGIFEGKPAAAPDSVSVPVSDHMFVIAAMLPAHLLIYETSLLRGRNPDYFQVRPR